MEKNTMENKPLISVIIPFYNSESYLDRCLKSVLGQDIGIQNMQIICVDDASTDNTLERLREYEKKYPKTITVVEGKENRRQGGARNLGIKYAIAPYVTYMDSDDWAEYDMYSIMYSKMKEYDCDVVFCRHTRDKGDKIVYRTAQNERRTQEKDMLIEIEEGERGDFLVSDIIGVGVWDKLYKKELIIDNNIFFPEKTAYEDIFFGTLVYLYASRIYIINERLYHYYINVNSTVLKQDAAYHMDILNVCEKLLLELEVRGFYDKHKEAVQYDFIKCYYLAGIKALLLRYTNPSYELFCHIKQKARNICPDYRSNKYFDGAFDEMYSLILELIDVEVTSSDFESIHKMFLKFYGR